MGNAQIAWVVLPSNDDALKVSQQLKGKKLNDAELRADVVGASNYKNAELKGKTNRFILKGLKATVNEQQILSHIQNNAGISNMPKNILLRQHPLRKEYFDFAQVECANAKDATKCVKNLRLSKMNKQKVWAEYVPQRKTFDRKEKELGGKTKFVMISNVHWSVKETDATKMCSAYGTVAHACVWYDVSGYPRGIIVVEMDSEDAARKVFDGLNGKKVKNLTFMTAYTDVDKRGKAMERRIVKQKEKLAKKKQFLLGRKKIKKKLIKTPKTPKPKTNMPKKQKKQTKKKKQVGKKDVKMKDVSNTKAAFAKKAKNNRKQRAAKKAKRGPKSA